MDLGLAGKRALVTGASSGLGRGIAEALAAEGASVAVAARRAELLNEVVSGITAKGGAADPHLLDLSNATQVADLAASLKDAGGVDVLVANSGGPPPSGPLGVEPEAWRRHFDTMIVSLITLIDTLVGPMREKGFGRILIVTSQGVQQPIPNLAISNTLRASLVGFSKTLAGEVAKDGVTVNVLAPGRISTDRTLSLDTNASEREGIAVEAVRARSSSMIPAGRYGTVEEFAATAAFMASTSASYITGSVIRVDGGAIRSV